MELRFFFVLFLSHTFKKFHSGVSDLATPWTGAHQAPLSIKFSRQEYWSGLPFPSPGGLPNPGIEPGSPTLQADSSDQRNSSDSSEPPGKPYTQRLLLFLQVYSWDCH